MFRIKFQINNNDEYGESGFESYCVALVFFLGL